MNKKLKIAIIVDSPRLNYALYEFINYVDKNNLYENPLIIINKYKKNKRLEEIKTLNFFINNFLIGIILIIENLLILKYLPKFLKIFHIKDLNNIKLLTIRNNYTNNLKNIDLKNIKNENIDLFISNTPHLLDDEVLDLPNLGTIIFSSFSNFKNENNLLCLSEVIQRKDTINIDIFAYKKSFKSLKVLISGKIAPKKTWILTRLFLYKKSIFFLKNIIERIAIERELPISKDIGYFNFLKKDNLSANTKILIKYILFTLVKKSIFSIYKNFGSKKVNCWSIAYSSNKKIKSSYSEFNEVLNPKGRFLADPFLFVFNGKSYIFVEDFFFTENKGKISVLDITGDNAKFLGVVLEEKFHLSFPFVFNYSDKIYMLPETHECNEIRLYECIDFPMHWKYKYTLMKDVSAADTILINRNNLWYMLTNICSSGIKDHCSELHIFYSDNLFSNNWKPIGSGNPVIFNSLKARNGGIFEKNGKIYRVNQVQSLNEYGYAFEINIIKILDEKLYIEKKINRVNPDFLTEIFGTHHYHSNLNFSVLDYHRVITLKEILKDV